MRHSLESIPSEREDTDNGGDPPDDSKDPDEDDGGDDKTRKGKGIVISIAAKLAIIEDGKLNAASSKFALASRSQAATIATSLFAVVSNKG